MAPFVADLGYLPRSVGDLALNTSLDVTRPASRFVEHQSAILTAAQDAMAAAQRSWHRYYDRNRPAVAFAVNDKVLLDTKNLDIAHTGSAGKRKFASRFIGPYRVEAITGTVATVLRYRPAYGYFPNFTYHYFGCIKWTTIQAGDNAFLPSSWRMGLQDT
ncbi:hypothetical protein PF011_g1890 [Phytophthora fragariae]|uniref:Uncharacterized protein n=1 Tax=Phytophthora fragariae TaxID=53985 RepID=A0A6A3MAK8_9STRA|nr:hypothetical protein PF003_g27256 [Phytophthora fragariae]KAE9027727.1 hypothetical protein PF011_g1890 [Phytophthora fragariae]